MYRRMDATSCACDAICGHAVNCISAMCMHVSNHEQAGYLLANVYLHVRMHIWICTRQHLNMHASTFEYARVKFSHRMMHSLIMPTDKGLWSLCKPGVSLHVLSCSLIHIHHLATSGEATRLAVSITDIFFIHTCVNINKFSYIYIYNTYTHINEHIHTKHNAAIRHRTHSVLVCMLRHGCLRAQLHTSGG